MAGEGDAERLVVLLEGRIRDFERNMQRAAGTADRNYTRMRRGSRSATRAMEADMLRSTTRINQALASTSRQVGMLARTFAGAFAGGIFAGGLVGIVRGARSVVSELSEIAKAADRVGLSAKNFQELEFGMKLAGIETNAFRNGMEQFVDRIGEAATRGGRLADMLTANGVALRDANGNIRPTMDLLREFANLVKNAASENEAMILTTEAFGDRVGRQMVTALRNGEAAIDDMAKATEEAGGVIEEELLRKAEEFDDRWASGWRGFEIHAKSSIMQVLMEMDKLSQHSIWQQLAALATFSPVGAALGHPTISGLLSGPDEIASVQRRIDQLREMQRNAEDLGFEASETAAAIEEAERHLDRLVRAYTSGLHGVSPGSPEAEGRGPTTIIPTKPEGGGGGRGSRNRAADEALRQAEAVKDLIDALEFELRIMGLSDLEREKEIALRRAGAAATPEQRQEIERLTEAIHREREAVEASRKAHEERMQAIENFFQMGGDALMSIIDKSASAEEAVKKLAIQMAIAAAQAALLGTGPLAGLFSSMFGGRMNLGAGPWGARLPGFATGTANTGGARGEPRGIVHGQEAVIPLPSGGKVPVQMQGGGKQTIKLDVDVGVSVDENGNLQAFVRNVSREEAGQVVNTGIREFSDYALPGRVQQIQQQPRRRG